MIRRILMLVLVLLAFTMPTEAITFQELQTSPQFKLIHSHEYAHHTPVENGGVYIYLNTYSIESVQYAPPKYALRGTYYVVYTSSYQTEIIEKQLTVNYDTSHSLATLIHSPRMMNRNSSMMDLMKASDSDSGLFMNDTAVAIYTLDGVRKRNPFSDESMNQKIHRKNIVMYDLADAMFMSVYQQHFDDIVIP